jgi:hypothetical protein
LTFGGECLTSERNAADNSKNLLAQVLDGRSKHINSTDPVYKQWFGTWHPSNGNIVGGVFSSISADYHNWEIRCRMGEPCTIPSVIAWVDGDDSDTVTLCSPFFTIPVSTYESGTSQFSALLHELTHLYLTGDVVHSACGGQVCYGPTNARALAIASPNTSIINAANYEFFGANLLILHTVSGTLF